MSFKLLITTLVLLKIVNCFEYNPSQIIKTNDGFVKGFPMISYNNTEFLAFEGIPYAQPPIGKLRFKDPQPVLPWKGIFNANTKHTCIQYFHYTEPGKDFVRGEEDCLYLNIYMPLKAAVKPPFDVIIFIHGGAFMFNNAQTYGPKGLLGYEQVVFVSINYRLGPLGFMSTEDKNVPGNMGIKDQFLALKWIKNNIHHFNGNPNSITLSGMSAGGSSVQIHTLSPLSKGLFHKAFMQSGTALNPWVLQENSKEKATKLGELVGCSEKDGVEDMVDCLRQRSARQIVATVKHFQPWLYNPFSPFGVVVDKWSATPILPEHPYVLLKEKKVLDMPAIFSNVGSEGLYPVADFIADQTYLEEIKNRWDELIPFILDYNYTTPSNQRTIINQKIKEFYFGEKYGDDFIKKLIQMVSDRLFLYNIAEAAKLHAAAIKSDVWYYSYLYRGTNSKSALRTKNNNNYGAAHCDDTICVLSSSVDMRTNAQDTEMCLKLSEMWLSFAKNGVPKMPNTIEWLPLSKSIDDKLIFLEIESPQKIEMKKLGDYGNAAFWNSLGLLENKLAN